MIIVKVKIKNYEDKIKQLKEDIKLLREKLLKSMKETEMVKVAEKQKYSILLDKYIKLKKEYTFLELQK